MEDGLSRIMEISSGCEDNWGSILVYAQLLPVYPISINRQSSNIMILTRNYSLSLITRSTEHFSRELYGIFVSFHSISSKDQPLRIKIYQVSRFLVNLKF